MGHEVAKLQRIKAFMGADLPGKLLSGKRGGRLTCTGDRQRPSASLHACGR